MKYQVYLFDFDGTLVDSMPTFVSVMLRILDEYRIPYGEDIVKTITPLGYAGTADHYIRLGLPRSREEIMEMMHRYALEDYAHRIPAKDHVIQVLKALRERGCSLHILTASPHAMLDPCLKRLGIYDLFENVWSCDDFGTGKSNPEIYRMAAERIGVNVEDMLFLDDNYNADRAAKQAGAAVCGVFDPSSAEYEAEIRQVADHYIRDFLELLEVEADVQ